MDGHLINGTVQVGVVTLHDFVEGSQGTQLTAPNRPNRDGPGQHEDQQDSEGGSQHFFGRNALFALFHNKLLFESNHFQKQSSGSASDGGPFDRLILKHDSQAMSIYFSKNRPATDSCKRRNRLTLANTEARRFFT